jgi:leucyl aminopeptidase
MVSTPFETATAVADGVVLARDLVNEPANILGPSEFAAKAKELEALGVEVEILTEKEMRKLGMGALLGVAQGSVRPPRLVVMQWKGGKPKDKPVAFIGKGVVFDTGGISIKPAAGMEDMKGDMGGAAAVTGLMHVLAARKAKVNAVGIIGLVENMPDGNAQRPGDIVTSMSGQTIEVINTDAEGRLVLGDALWYCNDRFKPPS